MMRREMRVPKHHREAAPTAEQREFVQAHSALNAQGGRDSSSKEIRRAEPRNESILKNERFGSMNPMNVWAFALSSQAVKPLRQRRRFPREQTRIAASA